MGENIYKIETKRDVFLKSIQSVYDYEYHN